MSTNILLAMLGFLLSPKRHADFCFKPSGLFFFFTNETSCSSILFSRQTNIMKWPILFDDNLKKTKCWHLIPLSCHMFGPDGIVVTSLAVTYLTVKNESTVNQGHCHWNPWDITRMHKMNRFGSDMVFGSDAAVLKNPTATYLTLKSRSKVNQVHCP